MAMKPAEAEQAFDPVHPDGERLIVRGGSST